MDFQAHNRRMVDRFIWLETLDADYAVAMLNAYRTHPDSPNPNILADVKAEKARKVKTLAHLYSLIAESRNRIQA